MLRWPFAETTLTAGDLTAQRWDPARDAGPLWEALAFPEVWGSAPRGMPDGPDDLAARLAQREGGPERITWTVSLDGEGIFDRALKGEPVGTTVVED